MKTLVFVWTHEFCNLNLTPPEGTFGIGDIIRGTVGALRYCEERGYECVIDISLHPLSQLLVHKPHQYSQLIQDNKDNIKFLGLVNIIKEIDAEFDGKELIYFFSNFGLDIMQKPASEFIKERIRNILIPNEYLASYIASIQIPRPFGVIHFRLGDKHLILGGDNYGYEKYMNAIHSIDTTNMILMSDSTTLKELAKNTILSLNGETAHTGIHKDSEKLKHTLAEFMILREASIILTYSVYNWTSGFVKMVSYIYDIQLLQFHV